MWYPDVVNIMNTNGSRESLLWSITEIQSLTYRSTTIDPFTGTPRTNLTDCDTIFFEFYNSLNYSIGFALFTPGQTEQTCYYFGGKYPVSYSGVAILGSGIGAPRFPKDIVRKLRGLSMFLNETELIAT